VRLAVDANVLLAALLGGRTHWLLENPELELFTVDSVLEEVVEHAGAIAARKKLELDDVHGTLGSLPVTAISESAYATSIPEARTRMQDRDPDDTKLLALALHLGIPIWSNDRDFEVAGVQVFTTSMLMQRYLV